MNRLNLDDRRLWLIGGALIALLLAAVSWLLVIHPKLSSAADLRSQASSTERQNAELSSKVATLKRQDAHIGVLQRKLAVALAAVPPQGNLPELTTEITALARAASVKITNIALAPPAAVASDAPSAPADTTDSSGTTESGSQAPTASPSTASSAPTATQSTYAVTIAASGAPSHLEVFLYALQHGPRAALVSSVQVTGSTAASTQLSAQLNVFSAPLSSAQLAQYKRLLSPQSS